MTETETAKQAAARELKEETGMDIVSVTDILNPSFSCTGFTYEKAILYSVRWTEIYRNVIFLTRI